jgi:MFS family permease
MHERELVQTQIPERMDRLPWSHWHWLVLVGLGVTWILDGLEVTLAGSIGGVLRETFHLSDVQVGETATFYLAGAVIGAICFGYATDLLGRKKLFTITLLVYLLGTLASAFAWNLDSYSLFRFLTGMGIGGEYAAINSAIDELIPARVRGHVNLIINATYWLGAAFGAGATIFLLGGRYIPARYGWRLAFGIGAMLGTVIIFVRNFISESPRWLVTHGRVEEAERIVGEIEARVKKQTGCSLLKPTGKPLTIRPRSHTPFREIWTAMMHTHRERSFLALCLMTSQAFFYNAIFFTYALLLSRFYGVSPGRVGLYLLPFALGNLLGPIVLGRLFDTIGRKPMIILTYGGSGILLAATGWMFVQGKLSARTQTAAWTMIFFIASSAASSAYLTVSELFPLEIRAMAISVFYAIGTLAGGVGAPALFGKLIGTGSRVDVFFGYLFGAGLMVFAAGVEWRFGVKAERRALEEISMPLGSYSEVR